ncbi:MAG: alpha-ketoglutarate-dependent dioxygenase AlkB [Coleofasciculus sp. S288]|nr:alpha-ketoglutarate-dependent dioxygenase AlkB [Coleofasciculus sp. S288]
MANTGLDLETFREADYTEIPGLTYIPDYINADEQKQLIDSIDQEEWSIDSAESQRRIQQHGYRLNYKNGVLVASTYIGSLPDWADSIGRKLASDRLMATVPDQVTINEYLPGQGVMSHVDCVTCFGNTIITLTLGSSCVMDFTQAQVQEKASILLMPGSILVIKGAARYRWQHGIAAREVDRYEGREIVRTRRVAVTFREASFPYK